MTAHYKSFEELAKSEREGVDYQIRLHRRRSDIVILAPHGGRIEPGTSEIAEYIAGEDFCFYTFEGIRSGHNGRLGLECTQFDEPECLRLLCDCRTAVVIQGSLPGKAQVSLAGGHARLRTRVHEMLLAAGFDAGQDEADVNPAELCNRPGPGLDILIAKQLRDWFESHPREMDRFVSCVRTVLLQHALERDLKHRESSLTV